MKFTTKQLKYEDILQYVSEEDIALFYLGATTKSTMYSLFREEDTPGKYLFWYNGRIRYNDWVVKLSLPDVIMAKNNWSYAEFMGDLLKNFNQTKATIPQTKIRRNLPPKTKHTEIKIKARGWQDYDLEFWLQYGISKEILIKFNVKPIFYYWINNFLNVASKYHYSYDFYTEDELFRRKLYAPFEKKKKWVSNGGKICQGENMLPYEGDLLIITKSLKDVMTLYSLGFIAIAPPSESSFLPEEYFYKQKERFKNIVIFYDNDKTGIEKANKFSEQHNLPNISIPEGNEKDISDYRKKYGEDKTKELINKLLYGT